MKSLLGHSLSTTRPFLISGPCVIESEALCLEIAEHLRGIADRLGTLVVFKASFDKANRTSGTSFRGCGLDEGLRILEKVRTATGLPVLTDVHSIEQVPAVAGVVDILQTPAFLARQTDLIEAVAASGRPVNIKKAQFMAPADMKPVIAKASAAAARAGVASDFLVCERGVAFGYNNLVVDMRALMQLRDTNCPVVFDATHSVQQPGGLGDRSGGQSEYVEPLARAAVAIGVDGLFMECHPRPSEALSDGPNAVRLDQLETLMTRLLAIAHCQAEAVERQASGRNA
jgi:2-dehydro-3-deoxyphosphooctonate aldolase (KDO 8-P synthase)